MTTAQQDTEITLGTRTTIAGAGSLGIAHAGTPATIVRPSAAKNDAPQPTPQSGDFSFYKAVGEKNADAALAPKDSKTPAAAATTPTSTTATPTPSAEAPSKPATDAAIAAPSSAGYYVQVAAVSRQEDAVSRVQREQSCHRQVLPRSGRTLSRTEGCRGHARPAHQRWVQSDCEKMERR